MVIVLQQTFFVWFSQRKGTRSIWYSRFFNKLFEKEEMINIMFNKLVDELEELLPEFGKNLAIGGKAISSLSRT